MAEERKIQELKEDIEQLKMFLVKKAKRKGIWEYFGQKERRMLEDKYPMYEQEFSKLILEFEEWAENFEMKDIK